MNEGYDAPQSRYKKTTSSFFSPPSPKKKGNAARPSSMNKSEDKAIKLVETLSFNKSPGRATFRDTAVTGYYTAPEEEEEEANDDGDDDDSLLMDATPKLRNTKRATNSNGSTLLLSEEEDTNGGVQLNPILTEILGVSFLPSLPKRSQSADDKVSAYVVSSDEDDDLKEEKLGDEASGIHRVASDALMSFDTCNEEEKEEENGAEGDDEIDIGLLLQETYDVPPSPTKKKSKNKARRAIRKIKKSIKKVGNNNNVSATSLPELDDNYMSDSGKPRQKRRRKRVKLRRNSTSSVRSSSQRDDDENYLDEPSDVLQTIQSEQERLQDLQSSLSQTLTETQTLRQSAKLVSQRAEKLVRTLNQLSDQLKRTEKALNKERMEMGVHVEALGLLEKRETGLREQIGEVEQRLKARKRRGGQNGVLPSINNEGRECRVPLNDVVNGIDDDSDVDDANQLHEVGVNGYDDPSNATSPHQESHPPSNSYMNINDISDDINLDHHTSTCSRTDVCCLDDTHAPHIIDTLVRLGMQCAADDLSSAWTPTKDTDRLISKLPTKNSSWIRPEQPKDVLLWSKKFTHGKYGSDLPVMKARGLIRTSCQNLYELLLDSDRVKEYNKMSLGRTDVHHFRGDLEGQETTKIIRSLSKPPLVRKPVEIISLMHGRQLRNDDHTDQQNIINSYLAFTRSVWESEDEVPTSTTKGGNRKVGADTIRSEMLLGFNLIREVDPVDGENGEEWCELTAITQVYSPSVPMMLAKKIGFTAAANFIRDLQAVYE